MTGDQGTTPTEFQVASQQLAALVQAFEELPFPEVREMAFDLLQAVDTVHRMGLGRLVRFLQAQGQAELLDQATHDPVIHTLFLLYDLLPGSALLDVESALDSVRSYIEGHGGAIELLDVVDGVVHLRLTGACQGCSGSAITLKRGVEAALREGFAGFNGMVVHEPDPPPVRDRQVIPLTLVGHQPRPLRRPVFEPVAPVDAVPAGTLRAFQVDNIPVLVANIAGDLYAVRNSCPLTMTPLDLGSFTPPILICPCHNEAYDVRSGKRVDTHEGPGLAVLPIALVDGMIQLAVNTLADAVVG